MSRADADEVRRLTRVLIERDTTIADLEGQVARHLDAIGSRDRIIVSLQGAEAEQRIRLAVLHEQSYLSLEELDRVATWAIQGEIPARADSGIESAQETATKMAEGPRAPEVRRDSLLDAITELRLVSERITGLRKDQSVTAGKVRIQNIDDRVKGILQDLEAIVEGRA